MLIEASANVLIGYFVSVFAQVLIFPIFGIYVSLGQNLLIGLAFTMVSIVRSYVLRRRFNYFTIHFLVQSVKRLFAFEGVRGLH